MKKAFALVLVVLAGLAIFACSGTNNASVPESTGPNANRPGTSGGANGGLPCDVDAVLANHCRSCHGSPTSFGAPMPLVTFADLHADAKLTSGKKVYEVVGARIHDDARPMPQPPNARLTAAETATLDGWIAAGAPASDAACGGDGGTSTGVTPLSCSPDQKIRPASKFTVPQTEDIYVCYGFDTTAAQKRHVIAGAPRVDNTKVVHHILLFQSDTAVNGTPQPCGGGSRGWRLVTGWAPGGKNFELPPEAGYAEEAGTTHWVIQIHYNNAQGLSGEVDETGFDLCTTDQLRPNDADIMATGTVQIDLPPHATTTTTCDLSVPQELGNITVLSAWAHMHRLGSAEYAKRVRGGQDTMMLDVPNYSFSTGGGATGIKIDLAAGDTIQTMCKWQNTGDTTVRFGEGTGDEMCFAFLTYYPKITTTRFHWSAPANPLVSHCTSTSQ